MIDKTRRDSKSVAANRFDASFFKNSTSSLESKEDPLVLELSAFERFVDSNNRKKSDPNGPMKVIKSRLEHKKSLHKLNASLASQYKGKSIVEWNKYVINEDKSGTTEDFSQFHFHDRNMYKIYLQLCDKRDSMK